MQFRFKYLFLFLIIIHISCTITSIYYYTKKNKTQEDNNISLPTRKVPIHLSTVLVSIVIIRIFIVGMQPPPFSKTFILLSITTAFVILYGITNLIFFIKKDYDDNKMFGPDIGMNVVFIILYIILLLMNENIFRGDIGVSLIPPPPPSPRYPRAAIARIISKNSNLIDVRNKGNAFPRGVPEIIGDYAEEW